MALHSVGADDEMLTAWDEWSRKSAKYQEGKGECQAKWRGFGRMQGVRSASSSTSLARTVGSAAWRNGKGKHPVATPSVAKPTKPNDGRAPGTAASSGAKPCPSHYEPCDEAARAIGCDSSYVAAPLLTALAATIGNKRRINSSMANPGGASRSRLVRGLLASRELSRAQLWTLHWRSPAEAEPRPCGNTREAIRQYERDVLTYDADHAEWKKSGREKGERPPEPPEEPKPERFIVSDITVEALIERLQDNPNGLLFKRRRAGRLDRIV